MELALPPMAEFSERCKADHLVSQQISKTEHRGTTYRPDLGVRCEGEGRAADLEVEVLERVELRARDLQETRSIVLRRTRRTLVLAEGICGGMG